MGGLRLLGGYNKTYKGMRDLLDFLVIIRFPWTLKAPLLTSFNTYPPNLKPFFGPRIIEYQRGGGTSLTLGGRDYLRGTIVA